MAQLFEHIIQSINNSELRIAIEGLFNIVGVGTGSTADNYSPSGGVETPETTVDTAVVVFDGTDGSAIKGSAVTIDADGNLVIPDDKGLLAANGESALIIDEDGEVAIYHDNVRRWETNLISSGGGTTVTGQGTQQLRQYWGAAYDLTVWNLDTSSTNATKTKLTVGKAGGASAVGVEIDGASSVTITHPISGAIWTSGTGTPEGSVTAPVGSMYTDDAGGAGTTLYIKESGVGNTGWVAK